MSGATAEALFGGSGPTGALARGTDWAATPLGPVAGWPGELLAAIRTVLPSRVPMALWWGPELVQLYNDAFAPFLGDKHPHAMGRPAAESWSDVWEQVGPRAAGVLAGRGATFDDDLLLFMNRHGYREETYWRFSHSPVAAADGRVLGIFVATTDTTRRVLTERRLRTVRGLGSVRAVRAAGDAGAVVGTCRAAVAELGREPRDIPFALAYLVDADRPDRPPRVRHAASHGVTRPPEEALHEAVLRAAATGAAETVTGLRAGLAPVFRPGTAEDGTGDGTVPDAAVALPLAAGGRTFGVLVLGVSPCRALDAEYRLFFEVAAERVAVTVADALAYQSERRRAESLAELDEARTRFFQNISHEFRTPLTLLLGPLRAALDDPGAPERREALSAAYRAALRLRRLVDTLLEAARADAARLRAEPEPTDLAALTADCAGMFRSAAQRAGLRLVVDAPPLPGPVPVDREMWSKILLNLLSNAVKYTREGTVTVRLRERGDRVELTVADTGAGIPADELPHVFDRFHRIAGTAGRSREGSGIGLSLVADLTRALGGEVTVASAVGEGSAFTVRIPRDAATGAARPLESVAGTAEPFAAEALRWTAADPAPARPADPDAPCVLLVEDNPDMRAYLLRLLTGEGWRVVTASDADGALAIVRAERPALVLSDVMLPGRDGLALVAELRAAPELDRIPIVLLTARAGGEAAVEGLRRGADDYVTKPFFPDELLARVRVHLEAARLREALAAARERRIGHLESALDSRATIGQAVGIVMARRRCGPDEAFAELTRMSQHRNVKLRDLAGEIVRTVSGSAGTRRVRDS
ncbi:ATP-binding protein [Actinomadura kijaniata]|uniref:ATP-binding protein n=1 Tax=Actinomadura kijaniata TaxID=46161 RepID=UPI00082AE53E|nr:ATP-binding protein [Actinomadura kijaniata]